MRLGKKQLATILAAVIGGACVPGCVVRVGPPAGDVVVEPGYYYDESYVDVYGVFHPRAYYYFHDGRWDHREYIPRGFALRPRVYGGYRR